MTTHKSPANPATHIKLKWRNQAATDMSDPRGIAEYTLPDGKEISLPLPNFTTANALHNALYDAFNHARQDARAGLLAEISRITP